MIDQKELMDIMVAGTKNWIAPSVRLKVKKEKTSKSNIDVRIGLHPVTKNLIGQRFGKWMVLEFSGYKSKSHNNRQKAAFWKVICDCNRVSDVNSYELRSGRSGSCIHCADKFSYRDRSFAAFNALIVSYKNGAKKRNLLWNITQGQFRYLIEQSCRYCGSYREGVARNGNSSIYKFTGIDRVDNSIGYVFENLVACCRRCNNVKRAATLEQIESFYFVMKEFDDRRNKKEQSA